MLKKAKDLIKNAKKAIGNTLRQGQSLVKPEKLLEVADKVANNSAGQGSSLMENDIIIFPTSEADLKEQLIGVYFTDRQRKEDRPSIGLIVPVIREQRIITLRLFGGPFSRGYRNLNAAGTGPGDEMLYPTGQPAVDFRQSLASMYETWKAFLGKFVQVDARPVVPVWGLKDGVTPGTDGRFDPAKDYEKREQRIGEFSYVSKEAAEQALGAPLEEETTE